MSTGFTRAAPNTNVSVTTWAGLASGETGEKEDSYSHGDRSVQVSFVGGVSQSITVEGSNDGVDWFTLTDMQNNPIVFTANGLKTINEPTLYIRPKGTGGTWTSVRVVLFTRR